MNENNGNNIDTFSWIFQSRFERGKQWYVIAATIIITATLVSFLVGEYLLGIVLILFCGVYLLYDVNTHPIIHVQIGASGILINENLYTYDRIESFGVIRVENMPLILRCQMKSKTVGSLDLYLSPAIDLDALRLYMGNFITENPPSDISTIERIFLGLRL